MKKIIITLFLITQVFAVGGFGFYSGPNSGPTFPATSNGDNTIILTPQGATFPSFIGGFFFYVDALPIVDFDFAYETGLTTYPFTITTLGTESETYQWWSVRESQYYTVRKTAMDAGIPFIAKAKIYGGVGYNRHNVYPNITVGFIESAFSDMSLVDATNQDFSDGDITGPVSTVIDQYKESINGFHLQAGLQVKVTVFSLFVNARYTVAKDVVEGKVGFSNVWVGLAFGI